MEDRKKKKDGTTRGGTRAKKMSWKELFQGLKEYGKVDGDWYGRKSARRGYRQEKLEGQRRRCFHYQVPGLFLTSFRALQAVAESGEKQI